MYTIKHVRQSESHHFTVTNEHGQVCRVSIWPNPDGTLAKTLGSFGGEVWPCSFPELFALESGKPTAQQPLQVKLTPLAQAAFVAALPPTDAEIENIFALLDTSAISDACAEYNAIEDIQFEALGELSTLRAEADAAIREHLQLGGLLTVPELTVARIVRSRASMAMRDFPA